jgi:hypothetical protein
MKTLCAPMFLALAACSCVATDPNPAPMQHTSDDPTARRLSIELLALDLQSCGRCVGTSEKLEAAVSSVRDVLRDAHVEVDVVRHVVTSADQARKLRFESSPTIRVDGRDVALEMRESPCADCGELAGCGAGISCRIWPWRGREYEQPPKAMLVEAILRAYLQEEPVPMSPSASFRLPENLERFFASASTSAKGCCDTASCCAVEDKAACCGTGGVTAGPCACR